LFVLKNPVNPVQGSAVNQFHPGAVVHPLHRGAVAELLMRFDSACQSRPGSVCRPDFVSWSRPDPAKAIFEAVAAEPFGSLSFFVSMKSLPSSFFRTERGSCGSNFQQA
jgi:hypothetical protein